MGDCLSQLISYLCVPSPRKVEMYRTPNPARFADWNNEVQRFREENVKASPLYSKRRWRQWFRHQQSLLNVLLNVSGLSNRPTMI